jgi:hypothetical protein
VEEEPVVFVRPSAVPADEAAAAAEAAAAPTAETNQPTSATVMSTRLGQHPWFWVVSTGGQWVIQSEAPKAKRRPQAAASNDGKYFLIVPKGPKLFGTFLLIFNIKSRSCQQEPSATVEAGAQRQTTDQPQPEPQRHANDNHNCHVTDYDRPAVLSLPHAKPTAAAAAAASVYRAKPQSPVRGRRRGHQRGQFHSNTRIW